MTLILPKVNDSWFVAAASRSYVRGLLSAGCEIHEFKRGLLHVSTLTVDGKVALVGSSSFDLNNENNILLQDEDVTRPIKERQRHDVAGLDQVTLDLVSAWAGSGASGTLSLPRLVPCIDGAGPITRRFRREAHSRER